MVIRDLSQTVSNWRSTQSLPDYLKANKVLAIADIDTRKLTRILRKRRAEWLHRHGHGRGGSAGSSTGLAGINGMDLAQVVSCDKPYNWTQREWI